MRPVTLDAEDLSHIDHVFRDNTTTRLTLQPEHLALAIAISLKRIADQLELLTSALQPGISDAHPLTTINDHLFNLARNHQ